MSKPFYKVRVHLEPREDGGLRAWSPDVPELVLSHHDHEAVMEDIKEVIEVVLGYEFGAPVVVDELVALPIAGEAAADPSLREYAARTA